MADDVVVACLHELTSHWRSVPDDLRPDGFWVAEHATIEDVVHCQGVLVVGAWFVDIQGARRRSLWDFERFMHIQEGKTWFPCPSLGQPFAAFNCKARVMHAIGIAHVGPTPTPDVYYLDYLWGGRWGVGALYRFHPDIQRIVCESRLWIS
ncbi:MAG: hypothetical protein ACTHOH_15670 [Lysobacteraceae bacterium]